MRRYFLLLCITLLPLIARAGDITVKSHIIDGETGEALPYVSVYASEDNGTLSNYEGDFTITVDSADMIRLTCVGYQEVRMPALDFPEKVKMMPLTNSMREVEIRAWPATLLKVAKKQNSEFVSKRRKKSQYFMRMTTTLRTRTLSEAFVEANSACNLRDITILQGISGQITQEGLSAPIIASMNFHHALELGPLTRDVGFWKKLITPLNKNISAEDFSLAAIFKLMQGGQGFGEPKAANRELTLNDIVYFYDVTGEELVDENQRKIYRLHINRNEKSSTQPIMTGTLYVDAKSMRPLRFDGQVENLSITARKDLQIVKAPMTMDLHINYRHDKKFTEISDIAIKMKSGEFSSQALLYNVDDLRLGLKGKKKNRTGENMLKSIADAGFDGTLWAQTGIIQRTKEEERLAGLENQTEIVNDTLPQIDTKMGRLIDRLSRFSHAMPQEKVYLHMDNTSYFLGDTIWFAAYTRQTNNGHPSNISRVLYVELYNQDGYMMERKLIELRNGRGYGNFALSKEYYGGFYELRAYTRWQLNWGIKEHPHSRASQEWYINKEQEQIHYRDYEKLYSRVFPVYDAPKEPGQYIENMTTRPMRRYFKKDPDKPSLEMALFPEGGNIVEGLPCRVAYEVTWEDGEEPGEGILDLGDEEGKQEAGNAKQQARDRKKIAQKAVKAANSKKGATATQTEPLPEAPLHWKKSRGTFVITPTRDMERTIRFVDRNGNEAQAKLPRPESEGVALQVGQNDSTWTFSMDFTSGIDLDSLGLSIMHEGNVLKVMTLDSLSIDTLARHAALSLPKTTMREGVNQVTIFDVDGRIWADRLFFNTLPDSILAKSPQAKGEVAIHLLKEGDTALTDTLLQQDGAPSVENITFAPYQAIRLGVQSLPNSVVSMSVRDAAHIDHLYDNATMRTEMLLASEVRGFIPNPQRYFEKDDEEHRQDLDLLMMIQGWRRFNFQEMAVPNTWEITQLAESSPTVTGHVYKSSSWEYHDFNDQDYALQAQFSGVYNPNNPNGIAYAQTTPSEDDEQDIYFRFNKLYDISQSTSYLTTDKAATKRKKPDDMVLHAELVSIDGVETRTTDQTTQDGKFRVLLPGFYGEAILFLSAADTTKWWSKDMTHKTRHKTYPWVQTQGKDPADYKVIVDFPFPRFVKPYNYYQQHLLQTSDDLMGATLLADGTHQMREVRVGAKRNGLNRFSDSIPAFMVDAYQAYNDAIDGGIYYPTPEMIVRNYLGDYGLTTPYHTITDPETLKPIQSTGIITRFGYDTTRRATHNMTTAEDSIYMRGNLASIQVFDEFGRQQVFMTPQEIARYYDRANIEKYVIYTDYQPRLEGSNRYKGSNIPKTIVAIYPYADGSRRPIYRDRRYIYKGFSYPDNFYHPNYKKRQLDAAPADYRRTLYWNPALTLDQNGHAKILFYNNGKQGQIHVSAEGMAKDGTILGN